MSEPTRARAADEDTIGEAEARREGYARGYSAGAAEIARLRAEVEALRAELEAEDGIGLGERGA